MTNCLLSFFSSNLVQYAQFKHDAETVKKLAQYENTTSSQGFAFIKQQRREKAVKMLQAKREDFLRRLKTTHTKTFFI